MILTPIKDLAKSALPEGKFREIIQRYWHRCFCLTQCIRIHYTSPSAIIDFTKDSLRGLRLYFPNDPIFPHECFLDVPYALPTYFTKYPIEKGSTVVDAGAFPGDFTTAAERIVGENGNVLAFEPNPRNRYYLKKVLAINQVSNIVEVFPYALASSHGESFHSDAGAESKLVKNLGNTPVNRVKTITLDEVLEQKGIFKGDAPLFIKMDIEGDELEAMEGAKRTLEYGAKFAIAAYHPVNGEQTHIKLRRIFENANYHISLGTLPHPVLFAHPER